MHCFVITLLRKRELVAAVVWLSVLCLIHTVLWVGLWFVIVAFPGHLFDLITYFPVNIFSVIPGLNQRGKVSCSRAQCSAAGEA